MDGSSPFAVISDKEPIRSDQFTCQFHSLLSLLLQANVNIHEHPTHFKTTHLEDGLRGKAVSIFVGGSWLVLS